MTTDMRDITDATFERNSVAFQDTGSTLEQVSVDEARTRTVAVASVSDGVMRATDTINGEDAAAIRVICTTDGHIWGHNSTTEKLYRSEDGDTWNVVLTSVSATLHLFVTSTGRLIRWQSAGILTYRDITKTWYSCYYSDNPDADTPTWTQVPDGGGYYYFGGLPTDWSVHEANGVIVSAEYGSVITYPGYINRSTDGGATWSVVHTEQAGVIGHYHAVGYHVAKNMWLCNTGDGDGKRYLLVSTDNGATWADYIVTDPRTQDNANQVTRYVDYGHPTRILCGSDSYGAVIWLDLETWDVGQVLTHWENQILDSNSMFCFLLFKYANVYYACQMDNRSAGNGKAVISVSEDAEHWTVYHRINNTSLAGARYFAGYFNGKLHLAVSDRLMTTYQHLIISPATVQNVTARIIEPAATNQCNEEQSSAETGLITNWSDGGTSPDVKEFDSTTAYHGSRSVHVKKTGGPTQIGRGADATTGVPYIGRIRVKGKTGEGLIHLGEATNDRQRFLLSPEWKDYFTGVRVAPAAALTFAVLVYPRNSDDIAEVWVDAMALYPFPCPFWHIGGVTKEKDEYSYKVWAGQDAIRLRKEGESFNATYWQDEFAFHPHIGSHLITAYTGKLYLRTYKVDDNNYSSVYYKADDGKFYIESVIGGADAVVEATAATAFLSDATVWVKVVKDADGLTLSIASGSPYIDSDPVACADTLWGELEIISGDVNGDGLMPHTLSSDRRLITSSSSSGGYRSRYSR